MDEQQQITCPDCGAPMVLRTTNKYKTRDGQNRKFYGCSRWPECRATHGAHPNGKPLGHPADTETKRMRMAAHRMLELVFGDWKSSDARDRMYDWLCDHPELKQHIGDATKVDCLNIVGALIAEERISPERSEKVLEQYLAKP